MTQKQQAEELLMEASAIIAGKHSRAAIDAEFSDGQAASPPIDLSTIAPADLPKYLFRKVLPTPAIAKFLDGVSAADPLTRETVNQMEVSLETTYGIINLPFSIIAMTDSSPLRVQYFYLIPDDADEG